MVPIEGKRVFCFSSAIAGISARCLDSNQVGFVLERKLCSPFFESSQMLELLPDEDLRRSQRCFKDDAIFFPCGTWNTALFDAVRINGRASFSIMVEQSSLAHGRRRRHSIAIPCYYYHAPIFFAAGDELNLRELEKYWCQHTFTKITEQLFFEMVPTNESIRTELAGGAFVAALPALL